ncbi:DUF1611 domain-containing protein [Brachybacterium sp. FME24]|uniref:DUF1611 domain-containing protein n=1 Tax=Brachybacterium sp. FME24 TaxID=2742605 RepID=UPI001D029E7C|nr:DUF1611 domain-containing protein [Brachybacterium sp. FME24]
MTILNHEPASETASIPVVRPTDSVQQSVAPSVTRETAPEGLRTRIERAKHAFSTRNIGAFLRRAQGIDLITDDHVPQAGEVILARVTTVGHHKRLESPVSRRQILFPGDEIVVAYGSRYAADQFLAMIPGDLGPVHLAAAGGLASRVLEQHSAVGAATQIEPIGVIRDQHGPVSLARAAAHHPVQDITSRADRPAHHVPVIAVLGTSMNSGKSTVLAQLAHGLAAAGLRVAAGKATGTGAGNDYNLFLDAGAHRVLDFTDFGYSSTFQVGLEEVRDLFLSMADELAGGAERPDVVLLEIADGVYQGETTLLLADEEFGKVVDKVAFSAGDALGAVGGVGALGALGCTPAFVSGVLTSSPLATVEARRALEVPVVPTFDLGTAEVAREMVADLLEGHETDAA